MAKRQSKGQATSDVLQRLKVADIVVGDSNHRIHYEEASLLALGRSMQEVGQLSPIVTLWEAGAHTLLIGERRLRAAKLVGLDSLNARVLYETPTPTQIERMRADENTQREALRPMEQAKMVSRMLLAAGEEGVDEFDEQVAHVAHLLGVTPTWVRDRAYFHRLCDRVREMVDAGHIPIAHARAIAKLHGEEEQLGAAGISVHGFSHAFEVGRFHDESREVDRRTKPGSLHDVEQYVAAHAQSLKVVAWELDVAFADKPACDGCPHNSASNPDLFEHDEEKPAESGVCMSVACYEHKGLAAQRAIDKTISGVRAKLQSGAVPATKTGLKDRLPEGVKVTRVVSAAKREARQGQPKTATSPGAKASTAPKREPDPSWKAKRDAEDEEERLLKEQTFAAIDRVIELFPDQWAIVALLMEEIARHEDLVGWFGGDASARSKALNSKTARTRFDALRKLANGEMTPNQVAEILIEHRDGQKKKFFSAQFSLDSDYDRPDLPFVNELAAMFGVEPKPVPKWEDYMPKEPEPVKDPKADAPAQKKRTKKKAGGKKSTRKKKAAK